LPRNVSARKIKLQTSNKIAIAVKTGKTVIKIELYK